MDSSQQEMEAMAKLERARPTMYFAEDRKVNRLPAIPEFDKTSNTAGAVPPHPLSIMTLIADNCVWVDLVMRTVGSACSSTQPLFRVKTSFEADYKKKARQKDIDAISEILQFPNIHQTGYELFRTLYENLVLYGNAYVQVIKNRKGELHSLYTLPPETIRVIPYTDSDDMLHFVYLQFENVHTPRAFLEDEIIHFKTSNSKSFLYGKPLFLPQMAEIAANVNAVKAIANWFEQGYVGGAIFRMEAEETTAQRNREYIKEYFTRPENFGRSLILEGEMEMIKDGNKFENFDFSSLSNTNRDNIIMGAGMPLSQAGIRSASGNANAEIVAAEESAFVRNTLGMYHRLVFDKLNARLFRDILEMKDLSIEPGTPIKFSMKEAIETVRLLAELGMTNNEARDLLSMGRVPSEEAGDVHLISTNNGVIKATDALGLNFNTGEVTESIFDLEKKAGELSSGATGLGGSFKKVAEGK